MNDPENSIATYYNQLAPAYDEDRFSNSYGRYIDRAERSILNRLFKKGISGPVLDMACGTGRLSNYATHGADSSPAMIAEAQKKHPEKTFALAHAAALPWNDGYFSTVMCFHLVMHLDANAFSNILNEAWRVLQPGGRLIVDIPSKKRRNLLGRHPQGWHGAFSMTVNEMKAAAAPKWTLERITGLLFFPVHRLPPALRGCGRLPDAWLCRSWLKEYASYMVVSLKKQPV